MFTEGVLSSFIISTGNKIISKGSFAIFAIVLPSPTKNVAGPMACAGAVDTAVRKVTRETAEKLRATVRCIF